jgi:uncharacterized protein (DUF1800 family)
MKKETLWSLRLGFTSKQETAIGELGIKSFLQHSFNAVYDKTDPCFVEELPKTIAEINALKRKRRSLSPEKLKESNEQQDAISLAMQMWWVEKMIDNDFPLREKMTCFWHNHFVATNQSVKVYYWVYQHNQILRNHAFGNFKTLTKEILKTNAVVQYLDNSINVKEKLNENLSRELLELFTLGLGNYSENDVKNGAKGLAGLAVGEEHAEYNPKNEVNEVFEYLGVKGNLKADDIVDAIFKHPKIPYLLTRKILKWFIYDHPSEKLVNYYGKFFKSVNFEIKPLLLKIFTEEYQKETSGSKIKDPITYILQLFYNGKIDKPNSRVVATFINQQGMNLYNQVNVKGWDGGNSWLNTQTYLQRNNVADILCTAKNFRKRKLNLLELEILESVKNDTFKFQIDWNKKATNKEIILDFSNKLLFSVDKEMQKDLEEMLKYDFKSSMEGSENAVNRLFNTMLKLPEYQLI